MHDMFADWYSKANREPTSQRLEERSDGVDAFNAKSDLGASLDLLRFLGGQRRKTAAMESLSDALKSKDTTFLKRDNDLELQVLATIAMILAIEEDSKVSPATALAVQAASLLGTRERGPLSKDLIEAAQGYLMEQGRQRRRKPDPHSSPEWNAPDLNVPKFTFPAAGDDVAQLKTNAQALSDHVGTLEAALGALVKPTTETLQALVAAARYNTVLGEESSMLWWVVGEHSRDLEKPLKSLGTASCLFVGKDLADLTRIIPGPLSVPAMMQRALDVAGVDATEEVGLGEIVDAAPREWRAKWLGEAEISWLRGIGQCLPAVAASVEVDEGADWRGLVESRDDVSPETRLNRLDWARLCHCECLLLREFEGKDDAE